MKFLSFLLPGLLVSCAADSPVSKAPPSYVSEAPLPVGWPQPGPYDRVTEKTYPRYRAAFTTQKGQNRAFFKLFGHIKKNGIPMTSPVEMAMDRGESGMEMASMGFLYQSEKVGTTGPAGENLEVRDVPSATVLSYTWQGDNSKTNLAIAKSSLETALADKKRSAKSFRLLGYNGPGTPPAKRTWELQAILK
ncbi:heme-binding protein [Nostoc sp. WHI]|uniref:heme-binding protein n=1 Tax=Nostoc sp. WHI TaxID=2650611 RepID=UPI0018C72DFB|nr:heme-binding protein [Nostoc sp. WHI]